MKDFLEAIKAGDSARAKELLERNPELARARTDNGLSLLMVALYFGQQEVSQLIAARKVDLDIHEASSLGKLERVKEWVGRDPHLLNSYSVDGYTPLALAAYLGQRQVVEYLLSQKADVNAIARNESGFTPLTGAVASGQRAIAELLLTSGADPNHRYEERITPLFAAAANGDEDMVRLLLAHGADASAKDSKNQTADSMALEKGYKKVAQLLRRHMGAR